MKAYRGGILLKKKTHILIIISMILIATGCTKKETIVPVSSEQVSPIVAPIINAKGEEIGEVSFVETDKGVTIDILADGLPPGKHGTHIHEKGVCATPDFESAGGHFNPTNKEHGFENPQGYHLGDLPNIEVDKEGKVNVTLTIDEYTLKPKAENSLINKDGSALVIHADEDDYKTDPSGNSGARIACAAIGK